jgi:hypothetical protein
MRPPKTTARPACLWLSRPLPGVEHYFDFVGGSERLSHTGTARRKRMSGMHELEWKAYVACCSGFPVQGVHQFDSP